MNAKYILIVGLFVIAPFVVFAQALDSMLAVYKENYQQENRQHGEHGNVAICEDDEDDRVEYVMSGLVGKIDLEGEIGTMGAQGPNLNNQGILNDRDIWIADTGASVHMTAYPEGVKNLRKEKVHISMGNQSVHTIEEVGDIDGILCDRLGQRIGRAKILDVAVSKDGFNLFSLTKMQQSGWILGGDKSSIWLKKDGKEFIFDIPVYTQKGMVFAVCLKREIGATSLAKVPEEPTIPVGLYFLMALTRSPSFSSR